MTDGAVRFNWATRESTAATTRAELAQAGAELQSGNQPFTPPTGEEGDYSGPAFEPLTVIAGVMGLSYLARQVLTFVKDVRHDGLIVDARTDPIDVRPNPALDRGQLLVITDTEAKLFEQDRLPDLSALIAAVKPA